MKKKKNINQKGSGLIMTMLLLTVMLITVLSLVMVTNFENRMSSRTAASSKAFQQADSAMEHALSVILRAKREAISSGETPIPYPRLCEKKAFGPGGPVCSLSVTPYLPPNPNQEIYFLDSNKGILGDQATVDQVKYVKTIGKDMSVDEVGRSIMAPVPVLVGE